MIEKTRKRYDYRDNKQERVGITISCIYRRVPLLEIVFSYRVGERLHKIRLVFQLVYWPCCGFRKTIARAILYLGDGLWPDTWESSLCNASRIPDKARYRAMIHRSFDMRIYPHPWVNRDILTRRNAWISIREDPRLPARCCFSYTRS